MRSWVASQPGGICRGPILAYFYRVDSAWAASQLAENRNKYPGACVLRLSPNEDLLMSPGLERAALEDLRNPDPSARRSAMNLLENGGSAAAEQPLWDAFARLREEPKGPLDHGFEYGLTQALLKGAGWVLTPDRIDRLRAACITDECRRLIDSERRALGPPVRIGSLADEPAGAMIGPFRLRTERALRSKIAQFPRGTAFRFEPDDNSWWAGERRKKLRGMLEAAGMQVVDGR